MLPTRRLSAVVSSLPPFMVASGDHRIASAPGSPFAAVAHIPHATSPKAVDTVTDGRAHSCPPGVEKRQADACGASHAAAAATLETCAQRDGKGAADGCSDGRRPLAEGDVPVLEFVPAASLPVLSMRVPADLDQLATALSSPIAASAALRAADGELLLLQAAGATNPPDVSAVRTEPGASAAAPGGKVASRSLGGADVWESVEEPTLALGLLAVPGAAEDAVAAAAAGAAGASAGAGGSRSLAASRLLATVAFPPAAKAETAPVGERESNWHDREAAEEAEGSDAMNGNRSTGRAAAVVVCFSRSLLAVAEEACAGVEVLPATTTCLASVSGALAAAAASSHATAAPIGGRVRSGGARDSFRRGLFEGTVRGGVPRFSPWEVCGSGPWARLQSAGGC